MAMRNYSNTAVATTLNGAVDDTTTSWTVTDGSTYPAAPFTARCETEVVLVTAKSGTNDVNWTVTRGYDGTTAASHADATAVEHVVIALDFTESRFGAWTDYTPTWTVVTGTNPTIGNGTIAGRWRSDGSVIEINVKVTAGSTTTYGSGNYRISVPSGKSPDTTVSGHRVVGSAMFTDSSTGNHYPGVSRINTGYYGTDYFGGIFGIIDWSNSNPVTMTNGDQASFAVSYELA